MEIRGHNLTVEWYAWRGLLYIQDNHRGCTVVKISGLHNLTPGQSFEFNVHGTDEPEEKRG